MKKAYIIEEDFVKDIDLLNDAAFLFNQSRWYVNAEIENSVLHIIKIKPDCADVEFKVPQYLDQKAYVSDNLEVALLLELINNSLDYLQINRIDTHNQFSIRKEDSHIASFDRSEEGTLVIDFD